MKNRIVILVIAGLALVGFAAAAFIYNSSQGANAPEAHVQSPNPATPLSPSVGGATETPAAAVGDRTASSVPAAGAAGALSPPAAAPRDNALVRPHSPTVGPVAAKVTIVEFFDPACEACRAFYPIVKQTMAQYPGDVRLVLRYAPLHQGSDDAVRILETARLQNIFIPVLEALLARQPEWAAHGSMDLDRAWVIAGEAGLDLTKAKQARMGPKITSALNQDIQDLATVGVSQTPTFFVNGKPLRDFGVRQFQDMVRGEVAAAK